MPAPRSLSLSERRFHSAYAILRTNSNKINGTLGCENPESIKMILKGELGFQGYVVSPSHSCLSRINRLNPLLYL